MTRTQATGINARGDIVGWYVDDTGIHGFQLRRGGFTAVDVPEGTSTIVNDINARGDIVGRYRDADGNLHGFLLRNGAFSSIDFPDADFTVARGINSEGDIVGVFSLGGPTRGFLLSRK